MHSRNSYNIPKNATVCKRTISGTESDDIYYMYEKKIVCIPHEEPFLKRFENHILPSSQDISKWETEANICEKWKLALQNILNQNLNESEKIGISIDISTSNPNQYILRNWDIEIPITNDILTKDFCGVSNIKDKLILVYLASVFKKQNANTNEETDLMRIITSNDSYTKLIPKWVNEQEFYDYCNS